MKAGKFINGLLAVGLSLGLMSGILAQTPNTSQEKPDQNTNQSTPVQTPSDTSPKQSAPTKTDQNTNQNTPVQKPTDNANTPKQSTKQKSMYRTRYIRVKRGDTLSRIAYRYRTSVAKLKRLNHIRGNMIYVGQWLRVR